MSGRHYRIVILGSAGAGKSTLVRSVALGNEELRKAADANACSTENDRAELVLPNGDRLHLHCPGVEVAMPPLLQDASGVVVLVDAADVDALDAFDRYLQALARHALGIPAVIGLSKVDRLAEFDIRAWQARLQTHGLVLPLVPFDARDPARIMLLMDVLMSEIESTSLLSRYV